VKGTSHLALGQEAVAAGFAAAMNPDDYTFCTYRGHHHTLARGAPMLSVLGELMGRQCGLMKGKGGSMHLTSVAHGGDGLLRHRRRAPADRRRRRVVGAVPRNEAGRGRLLRDGATNIGAFHEALNLAAVWKLPVVFCCENNMYMEYTPISAVTAVKHRPRTAPQATGLERQVIDGNDADIVYSAAARRLR